MAASAAAAAAIVMPHAAPVVPKATARAVAAVRLETAQSRPFSKAARPRLEAVSHNTKPNPAEWKSCAVPIGQTKDSKGSNSEPKTSGSNHEREMIMPTKYARPNAVATALSRKARCLAASDECPAARATIGSAGKARAAA